MKIKQSGGVVVIGVFPQILLVLTLRGTWRVIFLPPWEQVGAT